MTVWRSGDVDIQRGDILLSTEGKDVLASGRAPTTRETKEYLDADPSADAAAFRPRVEFSYRYVLATVSGNCAKLGVQILPCARDKIDAIVWRDTAGMAGMFHWVNKIVDWFPKMNIKFNFQGPAAFLAPMNPGDNINDFFQFFNLLSGVNVIHTPFHVPTTSLTWNVSVVLSEFRFPFLIP